jgi:hypothetical protein
MADDEIGSMKALMASVLNAEIMRVFGLRRADIRPELGLLADLRMSPAQQSRLAAFVAEYFDGLRLKIGAHTTLGDVYAQVVER